LCRSCDCLRALAELDKWLAGAAAPRECAAAGNSSLAL
jgi:hypothetical protein